MKRLVAALLLVMLLLVCATRPARADSGGVLIDGQKLAITPTVVGGVLMLPVRRVVEALGGQVSWADGHAVLQTPGRQVELKPGQAKALIESQAIPLAAPVTVQGGRMLAPASFLLTLFGDRLRIEHPGLMDPTALELLGQLRVPANFDFALTMQTDTQTTGTPPATGGALPTFSTMTTRMDGFVRGKDALITIGNPMFSPATGKWSPVRLAVRGGHAYNQFQGPWRQMLGKPESALPLNVSALLPMLKSVREAHLGAARLVDGRRVQDVVVTLAPAALGQASAVRPAVPESELLYHGMGATVTLDVETHELRGP